MARKNTKTDQTKPQTFSITAPGALNVMLVGDFTSWQDKPISMVKRDEGRWTASVNLPPGTYQYQFIVDGQWRHDPDNTQRVPNPYGGENSVRTVS